MILLISIYAFLILWVFSLNYLQKKSYFFHNEKRYHKYKQGRVEQSVTYMATDACLTADPGVAISIPAQYHTSVEIDHEIISTVILLPFADSFKKVCCRLQAKVCARITG